MIKKILVANRGEIAVRIMRSCREMGILSVAVFSEADRTSMHVRYADEAYCIGPSPSNESYLKMDTIIHVALKAQVDAIHPGYGFLSENAEFARKIVENDILFIGPNPDAISAMGDKVTARKLMESSGVPVVPGTKKSLGSMEELHSVANEIGYPLMIKASAGGGGKGMRLVKNKADLDSSYNMAKSEALSAFGDDTVYIEKYIESPHHIEFQILADQHGNTIHLFERECSVQRRHQKVVEETPSPHMTPELRETMGQYAIKAAQSVNYIGAGTIEFLVDDKHNFYFLEMNTRLQVEHPITERVTGIDIVKEQINIADGKTLSYQQNDLIMHGHSIECRIYAEDPQNNFMPNPGLIKHISEPHGLGVRTDGYVYKGYEIPIYYDPMISKLIIWAKTRKEAIDRMKRALYEYKITGVKTSIPFLEKIMDTPDFKNGKYNTHFIEKNEEYLEIDEPCELECQDIAMFVTYLDFMKKQQTKVQDNVTNKRSPWKEFGKKRNMLRF
ncbi:MULTISPECIES: acetyl-CoA carboxylase biotin carboxylase subunit [unclassified Saccharicrinis]|uniref:acetyl-CoA carboxylase biotin carboxylase subunit n=1 Tax=unclassified Saccharicrinis TaxID=2646859 RepID=UPI003D348710